MPLLENLEQALRQHHVADPGWADDEKFLYMIVHRQDAKRAKEP